MSRVFSFVCVALPKRRRAVARASSGLSPRARSSSSRSAKWVSVSRSISSLTRCGRMTFQRRLKIGMGVSLCKAQCFPNGSGQQIPAPLLVFQLLAAGGGDGIEAGLPFRVRKSPFGAEPLVVGHAMERGVQGSFFDAEVILSGVM